MENEKKPRRSSARAEAAKAKKKTAPEAEATAEKEACEREVPACEPAPTPEEASACEPSSAPEEASASADTSDPETEEEIPTPSPFDPPYKEEYCEAMMRYFTEGADGLHYKEVYFEDGTVKSREPVFTLPAYPTFELFAASLRTSVQTLKAWCRLYPRFAHAYDVCCGARTGLLEAYGVNGKYPTSGVRLLLDGELEGGTGEKNAYTLPPDIMEEAE